MTVRAVALLLVCASCGRGGFDVVLRELPDGDESLECDAGQHVDGPICVPDAEAYVILRAGSPPVIDGDPSDFDTARRITISNSRGTTGVYRLLWDDAALYISADVSDQTLNATRTVRNEDVWDDDSLEMGFDTLNDRGSEELPNLDDYKLILNILNTQHDDRGEDNWGVNWNAAWTSAVVRNGTENDNSDTDIGYSLEIRIGWSDWGLSPPGVGDAWGMDIVLNDRFGEPPSDASTDVMWVTDRAAGEWINAPDNWGTAIFSSAEF